MSRGVGPRTSAPRLGTTSTMPLAWSTRSASRIGVRLTLNSAAIVSCRSHEFTGMAPLAMAASSGLDEFFDDRAPMAGLASRSPRSPSLRPC